MQRTVSSTLSGVGLSLADAPGGASVTGSGRWRPLTTGESAMWTSTPKRTIVEKFLASNGLEPDGTPRGSAIDYIPWSLRVPELFVRPVYRDRCTERLQTAN